MKRILVLAGGSYISGAEKIALEVLRHLKVQGFDLLCCVSGWNNGEFIREVKAIGINFFTVKLGWFYIRKPLWTLDSLINYLPAFIRAWRYIRNFKSDYVYISSYKQAILIYPLLSRNIIYHVHDPNSHSRVNRFFIKVLDKKIIKYIAVSEFIKADLQKVGVIDSQKIEMVYNGVDLPDIEEKSSFDKPRIGIIGQLIPRKGHIVLLEAVKLLKEKYNRKFIVYIIGSGDLRYMQFLIEYVQQNELVEYVDFKGHVNNISDIYSNIDITVVPSLSEAFGLIAIESYFHKIPVIASRVGGLEEIVCDGSTGYLFVPGDAHDLSTKLNLLLDDPSLAKKMGNDGFQFCQPKFLKENMLDNLKIVFDTVSESA